jgi:transcriptional regulator with XRE-family HTH domain
MAKLTVDTVALDRLRNGKTWAAFAEEIGIDPGTLSKIRHGDNQPGPKFIANIVTAYPVRMDEIVTVVQDAA